MGALNEYRRQVQRFLRDSKEQWVEVGDIDSYINRARREVAMRTQCIRILTPVTGSIETIQVLTPGSGYTNPMVVITPPDFPSGARPFPAGLQATAVAQTIGGQISNISMVNGGDGYFTPEVTITDPHGTGATAVAHTNPINVSNQQQEIYKFSDVPMQTFAGVRAIYAVKGVSFIFSNYRYSLPCYPFTTYQAMIRQFPHQYLYVSTIYSQYGQGENGSLYMYPIPATQYQMEWDTFCTPADLITDQDYEAIANPWTDAVPFYAAHMAYLELQNLNAAKFYLDLYDNMVHRYSAYARPGRSISPYGRW
jgi:hypothetical protein